MDMSVHAYVCMCVHAHVGGHMCLRVHVHACGHVCAEHFWLRSTLISSSHASVTPERGLDDYDSVCVRSF